MDLFSAFFFNLLAKQEGFGAMNLAERFPIVNLIQATDGKL